MVYGSIVQAGPQPNVLVFGTGRDSEMWHRLVTKQLGGRVLFVEHEEKWRNFLKANVPEAMVVAAE
jgi:uncharacterized protein